VVEEAADDLVVDVRDDVVLAEAGGEGGPVLVHFDDEVLDGVVVAVVVVDLGKHIGEVSDRGGKRA